MVSASALVLFIILPAGHGLTVQQQNPGTWMDLTTNVATMSSQAKDPKPQHEGIPKKAIDGKKDPNFWSLGGFGNSCTQTLEEANPWWMVDLGSAQSVVAVEVTNRNNNNFEAWEPESILGRFKVATPGERLTGFNVYVDDEKCASSVAISPAQSLEVPCKASGKRVKIELPKTSALNLCEVRVKVGQ